MADFIDITAAPEELLRLLGKDPRLVPYGGANFGMPLDLIEPHASRLVPRDQFFVRSNGPVPILDSSSWRLVITGTVERRLSLSLDDLRQLPPREMEGFLECAGNGRTRFDPIPPGTPWRNDAVGNALWRGVALTDLLELAGLGSGTVDIVCQGADSPDMRRGLPLAVARDPDVLVVWEMNGEPLSIAHGGPVRLLIPGWAGIASTKWIVGLEALDHAFDGSWNTDNYVFWDDQGSALRPITQMPPKSVIVTPGDGDAVPAGPITISGWAWSGYGSIERVEVNVDGGRSWQEAHLGEGARRGWRRWETLLQADPGEHQIRARAIDERGLTQPTHAQWNAKGYLMNEIHQITVSAGS